MRIGVEEAILEHHLRDDLRGALRKVVPIESGLVERGAVRDLHPPDPFERDHPGGGQVPEDARDLHGGIALEVGGEAIGAARLLEVVELRPERMHELVGQADEVVPSRGLRVPARARGEITDDLEVLVHLLDHVWPSHLHDNFGPVVQCCQVRLPDRCARKRLPMKARKHSLLPRVELTLDGVLHHVGRDSRSRVLELGQFGPILRRQQVRPCREELAELDERWPELLERQPQIFGRRVCVTRFPSTQSTLARNQALETDDVRQVVKAVPGQDLGDLALAVVPGPNHVIPTLFRPARRRRSR